MIFGESALFFIMLSNVCEKITVQEVSVSEIKFTLTDVEYLIDLREDHSMVLITPQLKVYSLINQALIGEVLLDGMDMIPSFKVNVKVGDNSFKLRPIKVFNPLIRHPEDDDKIKFYNMELMLFADYCPPQKHQRSICITTEHVTK